MQTASQLANGPLGNQAEYQRHRPETTVLCRIVEQNWPKLEALLMDETQPDQPIRQWVISFPFQLRILLAWHFHFHILLLDGVYAYNGHGKMQFYRVKAPTGQEVRELLGKIVDRVAKRLVKRGVLTRDGENSYLTLNEAEDDPLLQWMGASVNYRIAEGPHRGRKVFSLQTLPERAETKPRVNLTRYHGVFAPNSADRGLITPGKRGRGGLRPRTTEDGEADTPDQRR